MAKVILEVNTVEQAALLKSEIIRANCLFKCDVVSVKKYKNCKKECTKCFDKNVKFRIEE